MSISINQGFNKQVKTNAIGQAMQAEKKENKHIKGRQFDEILISSSKEQIEEKKITEGLATTAKAQMNHETAAEKIASLKEAIQQGTYQIDAQAIASKLLMYEG